MNKDTISISQLHPYLVIESFEYTCPLLLFFEHQSDPFLEVEDFFNSASLGYYMLELRLWFKIALTENMAVKKPGRNFYVHEAEDNDACSFLRRQHEIELSIFENQLRLPDPYAGDKTRLHTLE